MNLVFDYCIARSVILLYLLQLQCNNNHTVVLLLLISFI